MARKRRRVKRTASGRFVKGTAAPRKARRRRKAKKLFGLF